MQLLLLEAGDGLATEEDLLLATRLLGLGLLAGHRQGDVTPLILGTLGIQRRQRLCQAGEGRHMRLQRVQHLLVQPFLARQRAVLR